MTSEMRMIDAIQRRDGMRNERAREPASAPPPMPPISTPRPRASSVKSERAIIGMMLR